MSNAANTGTIHFRYLRKFRSARVRHSKDFLAFVAEQNARLDVAAVKATGVLTASALANGATITIGSKVYTLQDTLTNVDGNVKRSGTLTTDLATLVKAINLTGIANTDYATAQTIHPTVEATASNATTLSLRAKTAGAAGNSIATTETSGTAAFANTTLTGGVTAAAFNTLTSLLKNGADKIRSVAAASSLRS